MVVLEVRHPPGLGLGCYGTVSVVSSNSIENAMDNDLTIQRKESRCSVKERKE
jgi:hypothetical protein